MPGGVRPADRVARRRKCRNRCHGRNTRAANHPDDGRTRDCGHLPTRGTRDGRTASRIPQPGRFCETQISNALAPERRDSRNRRPDRRGQDRNPESLFRTRRNPVRRSLDGIPRMHTSHTRPTALRRDRSPERKPQGGGSDAQPQPGRQPDRDALRSGLTLRDRTGRSAAGSLAKAHGLPGSPGRKPRSTRWRTFRGQPAKDRHRASSAPSGKGAPAG